MRIGPMDRTCLQLKEVIKEQNEGEDIFITGKY